MTLPPYPKYKSSGVEWLGEVPEPWEVKRLKYWARTNPPSLAASALGRETSVCFVPMEAVGEYGGLDLEKRREIGKLRQGFSCFEDGDVVVAKITPCFENGKGALVGRVPHGVAFGTTELHVLRPLGGCAREYLFYLTLAEHFRQGGEAEMYGAGGQKRVPAAFLANTVQPLPTVEEQRKIVAFLAGETAELDALTGKKRSLIERLREKRGALITRAVTRGLPPKEAHAAGLDPAPPLRASGVEWLGDIPAHWEVKRLGHLLTRNEGGVWGTDADREGTIVLRSTEQTVWGGWRIEEPAVRLLSEMDRANYRLLAGDLVVTKSSGSARHIGKSSLVTAKVEKLDACFSNFMQRLRCSKSLEPRLAHYLLNCPAGRQQLVFLSNTTTGLANLSGSVLGDIRLACPPDVGEQRAIADYLDRETARLDRLIGKVETAIERLREYRSALITAVVTGKVDVRGASGETGRAEAG